MILSKVFVLSQGNFGLRANNNKIMKTLHALSKFCLTYDFVVLASGLLKRGVFAIKFSAKNTYRNIVNWLQYVSTLLWKLCPYILDNGRSNERVKIKVKRS